MGKIIYGMSNADYHAHPALGSSGMKVLLKSAKKYWNEYVNPNRKQKEQTAALKFGSQYDRLVLETETYFDYYMFSETHKLPLVPKLPKKKSETYDQDVISYERDLIIYDQAVIEKNLYLHRVEKSGKELIDQEDHDMAVAMRNELMAMPLSFIIKEGVKQASLFWEEIIIIDDAEVVIECKARPDIMLEPEQNEYFPNGVLLDLKSTRDASATGFGKQLFDLWYQLSAYHYKRGYSKVFQLEKYQDVPWYWVCSEKEAPYESVYRPITQEQLIDGEYHAKKSLYAYAKAKSSGKWEGYSQAPEAAITPGWIMNRINKIIEGTI